MKVSSFQKLNSGLSASATKYPPVAAGMVHIVASLETFVGRYLSSISIDLTAKPRGRAISEVPREAQTWATCYANYHVAIQNMIIVNITIPTPRTMPIKDSYLSMSAWPDS